MHEDTSMSISIEGVIEGNGSAKLRIKSGAGTGKQQQEYDIICEKVADSNNEDNYYVYNNESEMQKYKIANDYAYYRTDLFLQAMISFLIRFPNSRNELASTTEEQDDDFSKLEYDLTNEIERMTGTAPPYEIVKLLLRIFSVISSPLPDQNCEVSIVEELMPARRYSDICSHTTSGMLQESRASPPVEQMTDDWLDIYTC